MAIQPVRIAVVGCGMISDAYLNVMINKFKILEVAGCYDLDPQKAQQKAQKYGIKALSMEEILSDPGIELVVNLTTPLAHYPVIRQLLLGGKHVYTEKVLTVELEQAAELVKIANERGLSLGAAPDTFLGAGIQTARYAVDSGLIGTVSSFTCRITRDGEFFNRAYPFTIKKGGGIGFDLGIYYITALLSILGPVEEVSGFMQTRNADRKHLSLEKHGEAFHVECETLMAGTLKFKSGAVGSILFDGNSIFTAPEKPDLSLYGSLGIMQMPDPNMFGGEVGLILKGNNEPLTLKNIYPFNDESRGLGVAEMAWALRTGRPHRASKEMAYHALEALHGIVKSNQTGTNQRMLSTFEQMPPIPRGFNGQTIFNFVEEFSLA